VCVRVYVFMFVFVYVCVRVRVGERESVCACVCVRVFWCQMMNALVCACIWDVRMCMHMGCEDAYVYGM